MNSLDQYLKIAFAAAEKGGKIIRKGFFADKNIEYKSFANPVTEFDRASEEAVVSTILKKFPTHSILAEENLTSVGSAAVKWIIDPLDGTVNFTHQIPFVCVSIGIEVDGIIKAGVIHNPIMEETYYASAGGGAHLISRACGKKQLRVSRIAEKAKSLLVTGFPYEREGRHDFLLQPLKTINMQYTGFRRLGSAAMDLAYVARGSFEAFYEENLKPWDTAAGKILVEEAGGKITDYSGNPYSVYTKTLVASNGLIHDSVLDFTRGILPPV